MECSEGKKIYNRSRTVGIEVRQQRERNQEKVDSLRGAWRGQGFDEVKEV